MTEEQFEADEDFYDGPSKSQRKRDSSALQKLGAELAELPERQLQSFPLSDALRESIIEVASMPQRGARKRQLKYIGGLLRSAEVEPILEALAKVKSQSALATRQHHRVEQWRDRLIAEGDAALGELVNEYTQLDRGQLRQWIRSARSEQAADKPPRSARRLYQYLRAIVDE